MKKNTALLTLIGTVGAIAFTALYAIIMTVVARLSFSVKFGDRVVFALLENTTTFIIAAFVIFEIVFFVWLFTSMAKEKSDKQDGKLIGGSSIEGNKKQKLTLTKPAKISGLAAIVILIGMVIFNANIYTEVSKDSIKQKAFATTQEYTWDEVYRYTLSCDESATLKFTVQMKNGKAFEMFTSSNTCSDKFFEEFEDMLTYAGYLADTLDAQNHKILREIQGREYMEKYFKESDDPKAQEAWVKISRIIE